MHEAFIEAGCFMSGTVPPIFDEVVHEIFAAGLEVGEHGHVFLPMRTKSSMPSFTPAAVGHGDEVEHGVGRAAERDDEGDGVLEGLLGHDVGAGVMPRLIRCIDGGTGVEAVHELFVRHGGSAPRLFGRLMPRASMALAMVLAVYMPPHDPGPGMAHRSIA